MTAPSDGNDPHRFAFWNEENRERDVPTPFRHREHPEDSPPRPGNRARRIAQIAFDLALVLAWIVLIVLALFFPSDIPDPRFGPYS